MLKLARFIVDKRKAFYLIFLASFIFCAVSISKVHVNDDITTYLPAHTETRRGLTLMDEEFITLGSANIMVSNITYDAAYNLSLKIEKIPGVSSVEFDDTQDHYHDSAALFSVSFNGEEDDPDTAAVLLQVEQLLEGYDYYPSTTVGRDESASLQQEMTVILAIAAVVIVVVLLFTSKSYGGPRLPDRLCHGRSPEYGDQLHLWNHLLHHQLHRHCPSAGHGHRLRHHLLPPVYGGAGQRPGRPGGRHRRPE